MEKHSEEWVEEMKRRSCVLKNAVENLFSKRVPDVLWKEGKELIDITEERLKDLEECLEEAKAALNDLKSMCE